MIEIDVIHGFVREAIRFLHEKQPAQAALMLYQAQGALDLFSGQLYKWELVKEDYEDGVTVRILSHKYDLPAKQIYRRAHYYNWSNPKLIERELKEKRMFLLTCRLCDKKFSCNSGNGKTCDQCKALQAGAKHG